MNPYNSPKLFQAEAYLDNDAILALDQQAIQFAPAPGENKVIYGLGLVIYTKIPGAGYTNTDPDGIFITYDEDFNGGSVSGFLIPKAYLASHDDFFANIPQDASFGTSLEFFANCGAFLWVGAAFAGGAAGNYIRITMTYLILDLTTGLFVSE